MLRTSSNIRFFAIRFSEPEKTEALGQQNNLLEEVQELPHKLYLASQGPSLTETSQFMSKCAMRPSVGAHVAQAVRAVTLLES